MLLLQAAWAEKYGKTEEADEKRNPPDRLGKKWRNRLFTHSSSGHNSWMLRTAASKGGGFSSGYFQQMKRAVILSLMSSAAPPPSNLHSLPASLPTQPVGAREGRVGIKGRLWIELMSLDWWGRWGVNGERVAWESTRYPSLHPSSWPARWKKKEVQQVFVKGTDSPWRFPSAKSGTCQIFQMWLQSDVPDKFLEQCAAARPDA